MTYMDPFPKGTRISQEFRSSPGGYNPAGGHTGRDYAVPTGTPVRAAADGIIRNSSWLSDNYAANPWWLTRYGGDTLVLDCTDAFGRSDTMPTFVYAHLSDSTAPVGKKVKKGEIIGYSGNSGTATSGPHCHVERLNPGYDLHNNVYGRSPLNFDEYYTGIAAQGDIKKEDDMPITQADADLVAKTLLGKAVNRGGAGVTGQTNLGAVLSWSDYNFNALHNRIIAQDATIKALSGAITAVSKGEPFDQAKLLSSITSATQKGVAAAIASIDTTVTLK